MKKEDGLTPGLKESKSRLKMTSESQCLGLSGTELETGEIWKQREDCFEEEGGFSNIICC